MIRNAFKMGSVAVALVITASLADAANISPPVRKESVAGNIRMVSVAGTITLLPNESVKDVRIIYGNNTWPNAGEAQGRFDPRTGVYTAAIGSFDLRTYYVQVTVRWGPNPNNITVYRSPVYTFGR